MKTFAYTIDLIDDPQMIEKYKEYHKSVWPEVLNSARSLGIVEQQIYLLGTRLFMVIKTDDNYNPEDMANHASGEKEKEWDNIMRGFQVKVKEALGDEWWAKMELVFDVEWYKK